MISSRASLAMDVQVLLSLALLLAYCAGAPSVDRNRRSGHSCYHCTDASNNTECQHETLCLNSQDRCLTQMWFSDSGIVISKRCARMQTCYIYEENNADACSSPDDEFEGYCSYCCHGTRCNQGLPPYGSNDGEEAEDENDESSKSAGGDSKSAGKDSKSSGAGGKSSGVGAKSSGAGGKSSGAGGKSSGAGDKSSGAGGKSSGAKGKSSGSGGKSSGAGGKSSGAGGKSSGAGGKSSGAGGKSSGAGGKSSGAGGKSSGVGAKSSGPGGKSSGAKGKSSGSGGKSSGPGGKSSGAKGKSSGSGGKSSGPCGKSSGSDSKSSGSSGKSSGSGCITQPPKTPYLQVKPQPPKTQAPATQPPATQAPATQAPATQPPATQPPATQAPATQAPATQPPATQAPATQPPATQPPATQAPATQPPATNPPQTQAPPVTNGPPQQPNNVMPPCHCHAGQPCYANHRPNGQSSNQITALGSSGLDISINLHLGGILFGNTGNQMSPAQVVPSCPCNQQHVNVNPATASTQPPNPSTVTAAPTTSKPTAAPTAKPTNPPTPPSTAKPTNPPTPPSTAKPTNPPTPPSKAKLTNPPTPPSTAKPTNPPTPPSTAKPTNQPTTEKATAKLQPKFPTNPTTTSTTTTTTTTTPTTTVKPVQCYHCKDLSCFDMSLVNCPTDQPYCMSTISQSATGARNFSRGCVTEQVCKTQWWLSTAGVADCFLLDGSPSGFSGLPVGKCSFCCQGDGCNKDAIPPAGTLYNPKTSPEPHPDSTAATVPPLTSKSSVETPSTTVTTPVTSAETPSATSSLQPRPTKVAKGGLQCQICGNLSSETPCGPRDLFVPKLQLCPEGHFCMIDVLHDAHGVQTTYKRCVSRSTCSRQWYHQTSDEGRCMQPPAGGVDSIHCHYCCTTDGCNTFPRPVLSSLYRPK